MLKWSFLCHFFLWLKKTSFTFFLRSIFCSPVDISALSGSIIFLIASGNVRSLILKLKKLKKCPFTFFLNSGKIKSSFCNLVIMCTPSYSYNYYEDEFRGKIKSSFCNLVIMCTPSYSYNYYEDEFRLNFSYISSETNILFPGSVESLIFFRSFSTCSKGKCLVFI